MYPVAPACLILFPKCMRHFSLLIIGFARRAQIARAREGTLRQRIIDTEKLRVFSLQDFGNAARGMRES